MSFLRCLCAWTLFLFPTELPAARPGAELDEWSDFLERGRQAYGRKEFGEAETLYLHALKLAGGYEAVDSRVADTLEALAIVYNSQRRNSEAVPLLLRGLEIREQIFGGESLELARRLLSVGTGFVSNGRHPLAQQLLDRASRIFELHLGSDSVEAAHCLMELGRSRNLEKNYAEAEMVIRKSLAILEAKLGPDHASLAGALTYLAGNLHSQGKYAESEIVHLRCIELRRKEGNIMSLTFAMSNLALLLRKTARFQEAERLYQQVLEAREKEFGPLHFSLLAPLQQYELLLKSMGRFDEARTVSDRMVKIQLASQNR